MIEPAQSTAGRALIGWSQSDLAEAAGVPVSLVERFETRAGGPVAPDAVGKLQAALEGAGVAFIARNGGGVGVRLAQDDGSTYLGWEDLNASNDE
jgi:transcriptional regulator with XRE-family HTH domain